MFVEALQGAHEATDIFGVLEVGYESDLSGLIFEVPTELPPSESAAQLLFLLPEKVFGQNCY